WGAAGGRRPRTAGGSPRWSTAAPRRAPGSGRVEPMARSESDTWDLTSGVGVTATMVAAARALASREPEPLIDDPFAAPLVRAVGVEFFTRLVDGDLELPADTAEERAAAQVLTEVMAVRTRFFDDFFTDATRVGARQAVILASGLDARAYRLTWPD